MHQSLVSLFFVGKEGQQILLQVLDSVEGLNLQMVLQNLSQKGLGFLWVFLTHIERGGRKTVSSPQQREEIGEEFEVKHQSRVSVLFELFSKDLKNFIHFRGVESLYNDIESQQFEGLIHLVLRNGLVQEFLDHLQALRLLPNDEVHLHQKHHQTPHFQLELSSDDQILEDLGAILELVQSIHGLGDVIEQNRFLFGIGLLLLLQ